MEKKIDFDNLSGDLQAILQKVFSSVSSKIFRPEQFVSLFPVLEEGDKLPFFVHGGPNVTGDAKSLTFVYPHPIATRGQTLMGSNHVASMENIVSNPIFVACTDNWPSRIGYSRGNVENLSKDVKYCQNFFPLSENVQVFLRHRDLINEAVPPYTADLPGGKTQRYILDSGIEVDRPIQSQAFVQRAIDEKGRDLQRWRLVKMINSKEYLAALENLAFNRGLQQLSEEAKLLPSGSLSQKIIQSVVQKTPKRDIWASSKRYTYGPSSRVAERGFMEKEIIQARLNDSPFDKYSKLVKEIPDSISNLYDHIEGIVPRIKGASVTIYNIPLEEPEVEPSKPNRSANDPMSLEEE